MKGIKGLILLCAILSCDSSEPTGSTEFSKVIGQLILQGQPLEGAAIQIDSILNWKGRTDNTGRFEISGVTKGEHIFKASKSIDTEKVVRQESAIFVADEITDLGEIRLPTPPHLFEIDSTQMTEATVPLRWTMSNDPEFREYKVYRKDDAGLDETTGDLIFVSTAISDTQFVDSTFVSGLEYYYRVYVLSAFGKLGGSNLVSTRTAEINYFPNGGFEETADGIFPDGWRISAHANVYTDPANYFRLSDETVKEGQYSFELSWIDSFGTDGGVADVHISTGDLIPGRKYTFSLWMKSEFGKKVIYIQNQNDDTFLHLEIEDGEDWTYKEGTIHMTEQLTRIRVTFESFGSYAVNGMEKGWFDDIRFTLQQ